MPRWQLGKEDLLPAILLILLPVAAALPRLLGMVIADPVLYWGEMAIGFEGGWIRGAPYIDPNGGVTTQALGTRAALDWLSGTVPWWNPYSGVGLPLAAEYQPGVFFPLTLLLPLAGGPVLMQVALQSIGGLGTYGLLRHLGTGRLAAATGGILFAFNGTLAWFSHGPAQPVPFLPWMLWGIERARADGWRTLAAAMGMSLLAGFPETAYLNGLLALAWTIVRGIQAPAAQRLAFAKRVALGGTCGIAIAAPQVAAFLHYLPHADIAGHGERFARESMDTIAIVPSLVAPYVHGPIYGFIGERPSLHHVWGGIGGYVTLAVVLVAAFGLLARRDALAWLLGGWVALAVARTFGFEPAIALWNLVPGVSLVAFYRYVPPSWTLALVILAAWGMDALVQMRPSTRAGLLAASGLFMAAIAAVLQLRWAYWPEARTTELMRAWAITSVWWAGGTGVAILVIFAKPMRYAAQLLAGLLAIEAVVMFTIPTLSNPRGGAIDRGAIEFLRANLGLQRYFTLGPIAPNYGAYFGIASLNHNYLPVARKWVHWLRARLDPSLGREAVVFNGKREGARASAHELRANLPAYAAAGVKYVVSRPGQDVLPGAKRVYESAAIVILEVPTPPAPYYETTGGCSVEAAERTRARVRCDSPGRLIRRELHFPGWRATVNGRAVDVGEYDELFQSIELPRDAREIEFAFSPPGIGWAWLASALGLMAMAGAGLVRAAPRKAVARN